MVIFATSRTLNDVWLQNGYFCHDWRSLALDDEYDSLSGMIARCILRRETGAAVGVLAPGER